MLRVGVLWTALIFVCVNRNDVFAMRRHRNTGLICIGCTVTATSFALDLKFEFWKVLNQVHREYVKANDLLYKMEPGLGYELDGAEFDSQQGQRHFYLVRNILTGCGFNLASKIQTRDSFLGEQRPGCEAVHSPPCSVEVKHEWSYTHTSPICLHGLHRNNFYYALITFWIRK